jgi:hypothetical protein
MILFSSCYVTIILPNLCQVVKNNLSKINLIQNHFLLSWILFAVFPTTSTHQLDWLGVMVLFHLEQKSIYESRCVML